MGRISSYRQGTPPSRNWELEGAYFKPGSGQFFATGVGGDLLDLVMNCEIYTDTGNRCNAGWQYFGATTKYWQRMKLKGLEMIVPHDK